MKTRSIWVGMSVLIILAMALTACQPPAPAPASAPAPIIVQQTVISEPTAKVVVATAAPTTPPPAKPAGPKVLKMQSPQGSGDIPTIDPALAVDSPSIQFIESTTVGLVRQNGETANIEPGVASTWDISSDGMTYTFHLRENIPWVRYDGKQVVQVQDCNGKDRMVTADDFAYGILRTLSPKTASDYAYVLTDKIVGAADYNSSPVDKADPSKVGVKALDPKTLEIKFVKPAVYNLNIAGLWVAHAQPKWLIDGDDCTTARADRWTETGFFQGYGTYVLKEWVHDNYITMVKNPLWPETKEIPLAKIDEIQWAFLDSSAALAEYEAGNLDSVGIPTGDMDRIMTDAKYKDQVAWTYTVGTEMYAFNTKLAPTDDVRVRLALSLSIDRNAIIQNINMGAGEVARWFTHPGAAGAPKPGKNPDLVSYDPVKAKQLLDDYLKEKGKTADQLSFILLFNTSESHKKRAEAVQQMWKDNLGITVQLTNQESKVFYTQRKAGTENIYRGSWVQDYPDANNFMVDVFGNGGGYADVVDWSGPSYDQWLTLIQQAAVEQDPAKRVDLYYQAEKTLVQDQAIVAPLYWYRSPGLTRATVKWVQSITGYDHYETWDMTVQ